MVISVSYALENNPGQSMISQFSFLSKSELHVQDIFFMKTNAHSSKEKDSMPLLHHFVDNSSGNLLIDDMTERLNDVFIRICNSFEP